MLMGTLAANLAGGYLIGVAIEYFTHHDSLPPELRLFVIVGFLGGLTTFSSFSAEAVELLAGQATGLGIYNGCLASARLAGDDLARHTFDALAACVKAGNYRRRSVHVTALASALPAHAQTPRIIPAGRFA